MTQALAINPGAAGNIFSHPDTARVKNALSSIYWKWYVKGEDSTLRLIEFLNQKLPHIPLSSWPERLLYGGVYLNARAVTVDKPLRSPSIIEYYEPKYKIDNADKIFPVFSNDNIIFEDDYLLAIYKPAGLPSLPSREQKAHCLKNQIEHYLSTKIHMPSRLDASAQGLILISKSPEMHGPLQRLFENRKIKKMYLLATSGQITWTEKTVTEPITRSPHHPVLRMPAESGPEAKTIFTLQKSSAQDSIELPYHIISAEPVTGRTHQIRVHTASIGAPILGDNFYGGQEAKSLHLLSYSLSFTHPLTQEKLTIKVPDRLLPEWALAASQKSR